MSEIIIKRGTVTAISQKDGQQTGLKLDGIDLWHNFSLPKYRKQWYEPKKNDKVELQIVESSDGREFVQSILPLNGTNYDVPFNEQAEALERGSEAPGDGSVVHHVYESRDRMIARQVALKAAVEAHTAYAKSDPNVVTDEKHILQSAQWFFDWLVSE